MDHRPFNDASYGQYLAEGKIMASRCTRCGAMALPPRPICISCFGSEMEWAPVPGKGNLAGFTSIFVAPPYMARQGFGRKNPYVVGVVELEKGLKLVARISGVDAQKPDQIKVGMPLEAEFLSAGEGPDRKVTLVFRPRAGD